MDGVLSGGVTAYDVVSGAWTPAGSLAVARAGHAAAVLKDGRVLIAGGTAATGPSLEIEIYDPATGSSVHAGDMTLPRVDAAAATLTDGKVLIVGGSDGLSPLSSAETFDTATGQSAGVPASMASVRVRATATTMLDGHVLVAGGSDGANDLASVEIFDPAAGTFFGTGAMQTARSGHVAVLLPNNNQVLVAGGTSGTAAVASAELYADWRDGFSPTPNPMSAARAGGIAGALRPYDLAFVAGGGATSGDMYGYATVKTDKEDYWPGEPVTVTGSGWQPGETVTLVISEDADTHYDFTYSAIADASGSITNAEFAPIENEIFQHFGKKFYLVARGAASEALNTFTDGNADIAGHRPKFGHQRRNRWSHGLLLRHRRQSVQQFRTLPPSPTAAIHVELQLPGQQHDGQTFNRVAALVTRLNPDSGLHQQSDPNNQLASGSRSVHRHDAHRCARDRHLWRHHGGCSYGDADSRAARGVSGKSNQLLAEWCRCGQRHDQRERCCDPGGAEQPRRHQRG